MRFITEFELEYPYSLFQVENMKHTLQEGFGNKIAESFKWKEIGSATIDGSVKYKASIEIEAFPMDKWIEFKQNLFSKFIDDDYEGAEKVLEFIKELESFSKPERPAKQLTNGTE